MDTFMVLAAPGDTCPDCWGDKDCWGCGWTINTNDTDDPRFGKCKICNDSGLCPTCNGTGKI